MSPGELESLLDRAAEIPEADQLPEDPLELRRVAGKAVGVLLELRTVLRGQVDTQGGTLAQRLRQALEETILQQVNGRAALTPEVAEHSVMVHLNDPSGVIVDVRLRVGKAKTE